MSSLAKGPDPTYHSSGAAFNGNAYVDFSGGGNLFSNAITASSNLLGNLTTTVFAVSTVPTAGTAFYGWGATSPQGSDIGLFYGLHTGAYSAEIASASAIFGTLRPECKSPN